MTDLDKLAREWLDEAEHDYILACGEYDTVEQIDAKIERSRALLAALLGKVRAEERERCAAICESMGSIASSRLASWELQEQQKRYAAAIRAGQGLKTP